MNALLTLMMLATGTAVHAQLLEPTGTRSSYASFIAAQSQPQGWVYQRINGQNDNMFAETPSSCSNGGSPQGMWGYSGGSINNFRPSQRDIYLQPASSSQTQNIEFHFCQPVCMRTASIYAAHGGHELLRMNLQRWDTASSGWATVANAQTLRSQCGTGSGQCNNIRATYIGSSCTNRWRLADWRVEANQWLAGVALVAESCQDAGPSASEVINATLHTRIDDLLALLRANHSQYATRDSVVALGSALEDATDELDTATARLDSEDATCRATVAEQQRQLTLANAQRQALSARLTEVEGIAATLISAVSNLTDALSAATAPVVPAAAGPPGCTGAASCLPKVEAQGTTMELTGQEVRIASATCVTTASDICAMQQTVQALVDRLD